MYLDANMGSLSTACLCAFHMIGRRQEQASDLRGDSVLWEASPLSLLKGFGGAHSPWSWGHQYVYNIPLEIALHPLPST